MEDRFHNILLPDFLSLYLKGETIFYTSIANTISGRELRILDRQDAIQKYIATNCRLSEDEFFALSAFFRARCGNYYAFLMKDHTDYQIVNQQLDIFNSEAKIYKIYKSYPDLLSPYRRRIKNVRAENFSLNVEYKNIDFAKGIIYMKDDFNPSNEIVKINCEFDLKVRFVSAQLSYRRWEDNSILVENMQIVEL